MTRDRASVIATVALHIVARYVPEIFTDSIVHAELAACLRDEFADIARQVRDEIALAD